MKNYLALLLFFISLHAISQTITVSTTTYTVPELVTDVLIQNPCINPTNISWRTGTNFNSSNGIGYFENTNPNFPIQSGVILSTGDVLSAVGPNNSVQNNGSTAWVGDADLENTLAAAGITMNSVNATVLEFEFTAFSPTFDFNFLFASEEYGNFQCGFSDAFAFLLTDVTQNTTTNLALVPNTTLPISVVTIRDNLFNSNCSSENPQYFGTYNSSTNSVTNFNGQTVLLNATANLIPNNLYRIKLVIADRQDVGSDSAIFLASNSFNLGQEVLGDDLLTSTNNAICNGQSTVLNSNLDPNQNTFQWSLNGNDINGETGPSLTVNAPGTYTLTYSNNNLTCLSLTDSIVVEYYPAFTSPNPSNLYKCNDGSGNYSFNISDNTPIVTQGLPTGTTVSYHTSSIDANDNINPLSSPYSSSGNQTIYVRINNPNTNCYIIKTFQLIVLPALVANQPNDYSVCENTFGSGIGTFNLSILRPQVLSNTATPNLYGVSYHLTNNDAINGTNPINPTNYLSSSTTLYIRARLLQDSNCFSITSVNLIVVPKPAVDSIPPVYICYSYTLPTLTNGVYRTGPNGTGTVLPQGSIITSTQTIYIFNQNSLCTNQTSFLVTIIDPLTYTIPSGDYCNSYTLPSLLFGEYRTQANGAGTVIPFGTVINSSQTIYFYYYADNPATCVIDFPINIGIYTITPVPTLPNVYDCTLYNLPSIPNGTYYTGPSGTGTVLAPGTPITSTQTIYIYDSNPGCVSQTSFIVFIGNIFPTDVTECVSYTLPTLGIGGYYTQPNGGGTNIPAGTIITSTQTIYAYAQSVNQPNCTDNYSFTVTIVLPELIAPSNNTACDQYILPTLANGDYYTEANGAGTLLAVGTAINESTTVHIYINNGSGCTNDLPFDIVVNYSPPIDPRSDIDVCDSYILTPLVNGNYFTMPNGGGTQLDAGTVITSSQTLYIFASENGCTSENSFIITVITVPNFSLDDVVTCETSYTLETLPNNFRYFTATDGPYGTGTELFAGDIITTNQTIYIFIESGTRNNCTFEDSFSIQFEEKPVLNTIPSTDLIFCDTDSTNDGILDVNLTQFDATVMGAQTNPAFSITYYTNNNDAVNATNAISSTTATTFYVRIENINAPNCFEIDNYNLIIRKLPNPNLTNGIICIDSNTNTVLNPYLLTSGLPNANHSFEWFYNGQLITDATQNNYLATQGGTYSIIATNLITNCSSVETFATVIESEIATIEFTTSQAFSQHSTITVNPIGVGNNFEYQLDNFPFQDSNVFTNVSSGTHTITVNDKYGCGSASTIVYIIKYPEYFTPNGDGTNDFWNINDLIFQKKDAKINIFDRYGKFIHQVIPFKDAGWDGTLNGKTLPASDYWFVVYFMEDNVQKEFKAHFALIR